MYVACILYVCVCLDTAVYDFETPGLQPARLLSLWDSLGKNAGVSCHFLLQIYLTQGSNPRILHCMWVLYC